MEDYPDWDSWYFARQVWVMERMTGEVNPRVKTAAEKMHIRRGAEMPTSTYHRPRGWYDIALLERAAQGPMTGKEIAEIMDIDIAVAVSHLRSRKGFTVTTVGRRSDRGRACLYRVERLRVDGGKGE
jgi:hypothetical protein